MKNLLVLLALACCLSSCSHLFNATSIAVSSSTSSANIHIGDDLGSLDSLGAGTVKFKANASDGYYSVKQSKEGYKDEYSLLVRGGEPNVAKWITSVGFCAIGAGLIASNSGSDDSSSSISSSDSGSDGMVGTYVGYGLVFLGLYDLGYGASWSTYSKKNTLPEMKKLPTRGEDQRFLEVDSLNINVSADNFKVNKVSLNSKKVKKKEEKNLTKDELKVDNTILSTQLNGWLHEIGFTDTTTAKFKAQFDKLLLTGEITTMTVNYYYECNQLEMTTRWDVRDRVNNTPLMSKTVTATSGWIVAPYNYWGSDNAHSYAINRLFVDALESSILDLMEDEEFQKYMVSVRASFANTKAGWDMIQLERPAIIASTINECSKATVTIKSGKSHGSGFIISKEGHVLTNYHVSGDEGDKLTIHLEDGTESKCSVVRTNPIYDLALLKMESPVPAKLKPISIAVGSEWEIGEECYAIGTPEDVELGQTVSRGIISGKRKFDERDYIQTDVSVNPGNSGGPLLTSAGKLLGVVNAKLFGLGVEGIGFGIPSYYIEDALMLKLKEAPAPPAATPPKSKGKGK